MGFSSPCTPGFLSRVLQVPLSQQFISVQYNAQRFHNNNSRTSTSRREPIDSCCDATMMRLISTRTKNIDHSPATAKDPNDFIGTRADAIVNM